MRAQGFDVNKYSTFGALYKDAKNAGYYLGTSSTTGHYQAIKKAFDHFKANPSEFDKRYNEMIRFNAGIQIALENADFFGNDKSGRSLRLGRTEQENEVIPSSAHEGSICTHRTGVNESHSIHQTVTVGNHCLTMVRVPYSRINGLYMMDSHCGSMYLGDDENEISADTHGLTIILVDKHVGKYDSFTTYGYIQKFEKYEKALKKNP